MRVYLDNAATTPVDPQVFEAMRPYFEEEFGNPSSIHAHGRKIRAAVESSRKKIAELLNCNPGEIIFTSGGTEADNTLIINSINAFSIQHAITTPLEHHAVSHTLEVLSDKGVIKIHHVKMDEKGNIDFDDLEKLLSQYPNSLISLMHANNEIGNLLDIKRVGELAKFHKAYFHSDTVQTIGHYCHNLSDLYISGLVGSAHKFHGPKGIGFMYIRKDQKIGQFIHGGSQERNMRGGTENVYGIVGMAKALEIAYLGMEEHKKKVSSLKELMIKKLKDQIPNISFNGDSENSSKSLYTVLSVRLPENNSNDLVLFKLDMAGVSASGGSACSSGSDAGSHVINSLYPNSRRTTIRFSFSKYNTPEEINFAAEKLVEICRQSD